MLDEIPKPEILDPDRVDRDDREDLTTEDRRSQSQLLAEALGETADYAQQLWHQLDRVRGYLLESLPDDPRLPGPHRTGGARPTGPDDDEGWARWIDVFAETNSVLCGAHGDSGYGRSQATVEAQFRRVPAAQEAGETQDSGAPVASPAPASVPASPVPASPVPASSVPASSVPAPAATATDGLPVAPGLAPVPPQSAQARSVLRSIGVGVIGALALRGLQTLPVRRRPKASTRR